MNEKEPRSNRARYASGLAVAVAVICLLGLGFANLGKPSLWHDETVHVFVAKSIAATGEAKLPSGAPYGNANLYNCILAAFIKVVGDTEAVVRAPAVLFGAISVLLSFVVVQKTLNTPTACLTALSLATSPWMVAWSRQARFYTFHQCLYLALMLCVWMMMTQPNQRKALGWAFGGFVCYVASVAISLQSVVFVVPVAAIAGTRLIAERKIRSRWTLIIAACVLVGAATVLYYQLTLTPVERHTVFQTAAVGGQAVSDFHHDPYRGRYVYYFDFFARNLSVGLLVCMFAGSLLMVLRERQGGMFAFLSLWAPLLFMAFLIGYRRARFVFFLYPFYCAALCYAIYCIASFLAKPQKSWRWRIAAMLLLIVLVRVAWSLALLTGDSLEVASGANTTLAIKHPEWRAPCAYVREHLDEETAVVATTALPVLYYVGRVDEWFPTRAFWWEGIESGLEGLKDVGAFSEFIRTHKKGFYLAEWRRLEYHPVYTEEQAWVHDNLTLIKEGSSEDVAVYAWGMVEQP